VLAAFERLRARLDREYEMEPDPEVAAIAARIAERRRERVAGAVRSEIATGPAGGPPPTTESDTNPPAIHHPSNPASINPPLAARPQRTRPHIALALITVILVAAAFVAGAHRSAPTTSRAPDTTVVAIAAIEPTGLIAACSGDLQLAQRDLQQARRVSAVGWTRAVLELAKAQLACSRPDDAVATLRDAYAAHPDTMGRYVPRTEIDFWLAVAFRRAGQMDSASLDPAPVRRAWVNTDPDTQEMFTRIDREGPARSH